MGRQAVVRDVQYALPEMEVFGTLIYHMYAVFFRVRSTILPKVNFGTILVIWDDGLIF